MCSILTGFATLCQPLTNSHYSLLQKNSIAMIIFPIFCCFSLLSLHFVKNLHLFEVHKLWTWLCFQPAFQSVGSERSKLLRLQLRRLQGPNSHVFNALFLPVCFRCFLSAAAVLCLLYFSFCHMLGKIYFPD